MSLGRGARAHPDSGRRRPAHRGPACKAVVDRLEAGDGVGQGGALQCPITALCGSVLAMSLADRAAQPHVALSWGRLFVRPASAARAGNASPSCRRRNLSAGQRIQLARCAMRSLKFLLLSAILALGRATIGLAEDQKPVTILRGISAPSPPPPPSAPAPPSVGAENYGYMPGYDIPDYLPYYFLSTPHRFARHFSGLPSARPRAHAVPLGFPLLNPPRR